MTRAIDLFCGAGGLTLGATWAGVDVVAGVDLNEVAIATYDAAGFNGIAAPISPELVQWLDVHFGPIDLVMGGPPCQPFSSLGKKLGRDDPRNGVDLFMRAVEVLDPTYVVMEEVPRIATKYRDVVEEAADVLYGRGYDVCEWLLNAAEYGVAQDRKRFFLIGTKGCPSPPPPQGGIRGVGDVLPGLVDECPAIRNEQISAVSRALALPAPTVTGRGTMYTCDAVGLPRRKGERHRGRRMLPAELGILQSFPPDYPWQGTIAARHQQVGNAVPPLLGEAVVRRVVGHRADFIMPSTGSGRAPNPPNPTELDRLLALYWNGEVLPYSELPSEAKQALVLLSDAVAWYDDPDECAAFHQSFGFALFDVPMEEVTAAVMRPIPGALTLSERFLTWEDYHAWYTQEAIGHGGLDPSERPELWPVIAYAQNGHSELIWDGWHRLHTYYMRGEEVVPFLVVVTPTGGPYTTLPGP